jgi:hypothetical protein
VTEPITTPAAAADSMDSSAVQIQTIYMQGIRGAGKGGLEAAQAAVNVATTIRTSGATEAAAMATMEKEAAELAARGGHEAGRLKIAALAERRATFESKAQERHAQARSLVDVAEATFRLSLVPKGSADPARRELARSEIDSALAGVHGAEIVNQVDKLIGYDDDVTAELLRTGYGQRLIARQAQSPQQAALLWRAVLLKGTDRLKTTATTETARAAARGLASVDQLRGSLDATKAAAFMRAGITGKRAR